MAKTIKYFLKHPFISDARFLSWSAVNVVAAATNTNKEVLNFKKR